MIGNCLFLALEDQTRMAKDFDDQRRDAEEEQLRLQQERIDADREHERRMERINYERQEKDKIVSEIHFLSLPSIISLPSISYYGV